MSPLAIRAGAALLFCGACAFTACSADVTPGGDANFSSADGGDAAIPADAAAPSGGPRLDLGPSDPAADGGACQPAFPIDTAHEVPAQLGAVPWVTAGAGGALVYATDANGNHVPDFSNVGYGGGGVALPQVAPAPGSGPLAPSGGDDTAAIQAALDACGKLPQNAQGQRGAVLLGAGTFTIAGTLHVDASGVVLRGAGEDAQTGTILRATGAARAVLTVGPAGKPSRGAHPLAHVTDAYVPVGARTLHVDDAAGLAPGTRVIVERPQTDPWICAIGMNQIPPRPDGKPIVQWSADSGLQFDRVLTAVAGTELTLDAPLTNALEAEYADSTVWAYDFPSRLEQVGVEQLRSVAAFDVIDTTTYFNSQFIVLDAVENAWVSHVTAVAYSNAAVEIGAAAKWITVQDSSLLQPIVPNTPALPNGFTFMGQQSLVQRCAIVGDNIWAIVTEAHVPGPNVALDITITGSNANVSTHQRWGTGLLVDRATVGGKVSIQNRAWDGTGHGWSGANCVVWNSTATSFTVDNPVTAQNWVLGGSAPATFGTAYYSDFNTTLNPSSLFLAQLQSRLGPSAVQAISH
ncbi:MAG TPA: hypothetical protein VFF06_19190 [Polyangia bacterium]|nr:hypothetical protein [Polyangia bacterium]